MAWRRSKTGQIIWYINRTYRVLATLGIGARLSEAFCQCINVRKVVIWWPLSLIGVRIQLGLGGDSAF